MSSQTWATLVTDCGPLEPRLLRRLLSAYPTGVAVLAALDATEPVGMAVNSFVSVSLEPPLVAVCLAQNSTTWPRLRRAKQLGISILSATQESLGHQLSARGVDRFAGVAWYETQSGGVLLQGASAWFECSIEQTIEAGDHEIGLLRVLRAEADLEVPPLVFHRGRFRGLDTDARASHAPTGH